MLQALRARANRALDIIYKENVAHPHEADEEKSRDILERAFSHVLSYLLNQDPDFYFSAAIGPLLGVIQGDLAS